MEADLKPTKLVINLRDGIVQVEGTEDFVRSVYDDFKERVVKPVFIPPSLERFPEENSTRPMPALEQHRRKGKAAKDPNKEGARSKVVGQFKPNFNTKLDLSELPTFYGALAPSSHAEKILIFAVFLRDKLKILPCSADDIYSCYFILKSETEIPEAFTQAFRNTKHRTHFIEYESLTEVRVTIAGDNHFNRMSRKKTGDE